VKFVPRGKAVWNANGGFVSVLLTHLFLFLFTDMLPVLIKYFVRIKVTVNVTLPIYNSPVFSVEMCQP